MKIHAWQNFDRHFANYFAKAFNAEVVDKSPLLEALPKSKTLEHSVIIEVDSHFIIVDHYDWNDIDCYELLAEERTIGLLKCQYRNEGYATGKIVPYTYLVRDSEQFYPLAYSHQKKVSNEIYFQGNLRYGRRAKLEQLAQYINADWQEYSSLEDYITRLGNAKTALSFAGNGGHCHREHEAMYLETPVIMPPLVNTFYHPLIAGWHYLPLHSPEDIAAKRHTTAIVDRAKEWHRYNVIGCAELLSEIVTNEFDYDIN